MEPKERESQIKSLKRHLIASQTQTIQALDYDRRALENVLPHRSPFALIDNVIALSLEERMIITETRINKDDPVFKGHFPDHPVYPGVLQIEMMGQAGLCLLYFLLNKSTEIHPENISVKGLFTRIHNAGFIQQVLPGDRLEVRAKMLEYDDFLGIMSVQVCRGETICAHSILEAYLA